MSHNTVKDYYSKIRQFQPYCEAVQKSTIDSLIADIKDGKKDRYSVLSSYAAYLKRQGRKDNYLRDLVKSARSFLEFHGIEYSDRRYRAQVRLPRKIRREREAISRDGIRDILLSCSNIWLKTYLLCLAATGMRPIEACSIRHCDLGLDAKQPRVTIRAEYTKMRRERYVYLTSELRDQIKALISHKHRNRNLVITHKSGRHETIQLKPILRPKDLLFAIYKRDETAKPVKPHSLYTIYSGKLQGLLDRSGKGEREDHSNRRKITLYSLRRYAKSTISSLGQSDFSEWFIGHQGSEYFSRTEQERIAIFKKVEEGLIFLDYTGLETRGADNSSKIDSLAEQIAHLKGVVSGLKDYIDEQGPLAEKNVEKAIRPSDLDEVKIGEGAKPK